MPRFSHDKIELWYSTPDAPAPDGTTEQRQGVSVTAGVCPANLSNAVSVRYRVDGRSVATVPAPLIASNFQERTQYFRAMFPTFWSGKTVEYLPVVSCEGRRAPDPATAITFPSSFRLSTASAVSLAGRSTGTGSDVGADFPVRFEHLVHVKVRLAAEPEVIGETPAGFVINWLPVSGTLDGPAFRAMVIAGGEHQMSIRADGMGRMTVSVTIKTHDGALIQLRYSGTADYGEDWGMRLARGGWPTVLPVRSCIHLLTAAPKYRWLNRMHCLGVGEVRPAERLYSYDMYAVR
jgi:hypothetical protein